MSRNTGVCVLVLSCLLFEDGLGAQAPGNLLFCRRRRGEAGTYVASADGRDLRRVLFLCGPEVSPRFSPDGKRILFCLLKAGKPSVWIADREGRDRRQICAGDQATWSPDGSKIFFRRDRLIVERDLASGTEKIVSPPGWKTCAFPDCSPDGKSLLLVAEVEGRTRLWATAPGDRNPKALADLSVALPARWSPDGRRIAYGDGIHVFIAGADGSGKYRLSSAGGVERDPAWSPDGTMIAYCHAPTVDGRWVLCIAKTDGTQNRVLPNDEDVVSFFAPDWRAAGVRPAESAASIRPSPRVSVWNVGAVPSLVPGAREEFLEKRQGWKLLADAAALHGGLAIESERALVVLGSTACPVIFFSKPLGKQGTVVELIPASETGEEARKIESLKLTRSDGEEAVVEISSSTAAGQTVRTSWRFCGTRPSVQISPTENAGSMRVRAEMKYVVVPDRFADDLLCEPGLCAGETVALPAAPMVLGLVGSGEAMLEIACPSEGQTADLLKGAGPRKQFSGAEIRFAKAPFVVAVLTGQRLWHEQRLGAKYDRKRIDLDWEMPVPGAWRLAVRVDGRIYSETFGDGQSPRLDGKRLFLTEREEFSGLVDLALVYLYGRSSGTPLERLTPTDVGLDAMGMEAFFKAFDLDGLQSYRTAPRPTTWADVFASLESLRHLYDRGVEKEEKAFAEHLCDDVPALFAGMDSRLDEFAALAREITELAGRSEKETPEAQALVAALKPTLGRLEAACQRRSKLIPTADAIACAGQIKELTPKELKSPSEKRKKFLELSGKLAQAASGRADLIRVLRALTRELRDLAGASCFEHPGLRDTAARLRQLAQDVLRNRYYFEADWRGEPHRVAPYWLGGRPY